MITRYLLGVCLIILSSQLSSQTFTISFDKKFVDCAAGQVCYDVLLAAQDTFDLANYNLRMFYDCSVVEYQTNSANVNQLPSSYVLTNEIDRCLDVTGLGSLPFEQTLSYLEIAIDFNIANAVQIGSQNTVILQNLCFDLLNDDILLDPSVCFDLIWATNETIEDYITSTTGISGPNGTVDLAASTYISLDDTNNCFETDCIVIDDECIPIVDADQDGVCDVGNNPDPDPNDPCVPNFTDADDDGVCDIGDDPDPNDPCVPNFVDADGDGVCDIGANADPDPNDPCNPSFTAPNCTDPMVEFALSFSDGIVDCDSSSICYTVEMEALGRAFSLGSYNLRIFYDGDLIDAVDQSPNLAGNPNLQNNYAITSINDMQGGNQSGNGSLTFDDNLDILDVSVNNVSVNPISIDSTNKTILYDLCFNVVDRTVIDDPETCIDLIWVNSQTNENYTTGVTTVNVASSIGVTADLSASIYENLDRNENCFEFACIEDECSVMVCNNDVQISLDTCAVKVDPDELLESPRVAPYTFEFYTLSGQFVREDSLFGFDNGQTYTYKARCLENSCWGSITIEANIFPEFNNPCNCKGDDEPLPAECRISCATGRIPEGVFTIEEVQDMVNQCDPNLVSELQVRSSVLDTFCHTETEVHELVYSALVFRHGKKERVDILCQRYGFDNIALEGYQFDRFFKFPNHITIECDQTVGSQTLPDSILAQTDDLTNAYPYFLGPHRNRIDTQIVEVDRIPVQTGIKVISEKLVAIEGVGEDESKWVLVTEVKPIFKDSIVFDTIEVEVLDEEEQFLIKDKLCNVVVSYSDTEFSICGSSRQIFRKWHVYDWCNQEVSQDRTQLIEVIDTRAPELILELEGQVFPIKAINDVQAFIDPWSCKGDYKLPELNLRDNCNSSIDISWSTSVGTVEDGYIRDIPKNNIPVEVTASLLDKCKNESFVFFNVSVLDTIKPVASCLNELVVSLTTDGDQLNGLVRVNAEDLSRGSNDAGCDSLSYGVVARLNPDPQKPLPRGSQSINFSCVDLGRDLSVFLIVEDEARNRNVCEVNIIVQNDFDPDIACSDLVVDCGDEPVIQRPQIIGDFCNDFLRSLFIREESFLSDCRQNGMLREWYLDLNGDEIFSEGDPFCTQKITFSDSTIFDPYKIKWPKHYDGTFRKGDRLECDTLGNVVTLGDRYIEMGGTEVCDFDPNAYGRPEWCNSDCGLVAASLEIDTIYTTDFCLKLINRWTVIDWCAFQANGSNEDLDNDSFTPVEDWAQNICANCDNNYGPQIQDSVYFQYDQVDEDGYYSYEQVIKIKDETSPEITAEDIIVNVIGGSTSKNDVSNCTSSGELIATAEDFCGEISVTNPNLKWRIKYNTGQSESEFFAVGSELNIPTLEGEPGEQHTVELTVFDGCGNSTSKEIAVDFIDNKKPTPICVSGVTTAFIQANDSIAVWANDFDFGSFDNCSGIIYSVVRAEENPILPTEEGFENQQSIVFTCQDISNIIELDVWVWDTSGNGDFCRIDVNVNGECDPEQSANFLIEGRFETGWLNPIEDVEVNIFGQDLSEYPQSDITNRFGNYAFPQNPNNIQFTISGFKNDNPLNGVSTLDIVLMQKHIIGTDLLNSPYSIIAADINGDQIVSATDIVNLRKLILGFESGLSSDQSWKFINASQNFIDNKSPWPFQEELIIESLDFDARNQNFIGIKMGDMSGDAIVNGLESIETRKINHEFSFEVVDDTFTEGEKVRVGFTAEKMTKLDGFQMTLNHEGLEFVSSESGKINLQNNHIGIHKDQLTFSWNGELNHNADNIFYLHFVANKNGSISESLQINSSITKSEAYQSFEIFDIKLEFKKSKEPFAQLYQNKPNPFSDRTIIKFNLPKTAKIDLSVYDLNGKVVKKVEGLYEAGEHNISLDRTDIKESGILYYLLKVGDYISDTYRVVVID